jgi:hypothetical protein
MLTNSAVFRTRAALVLICPAFRLFTSNAQLSSRPARSPGDRKRPIMAGNLRALAAMIAEAGSHALRTRKEQPCWRRRTSKYFSKESAAKETKMGEELKDPTTHSLHNQRI